MASEHNKIVDENGNVHYIVVLDLTIDVKNTNPTEWDWNELLNLDTAWGEKAEVVMSSYKKVVY